MTRTPGLPPAATPVPGEALHAGASATPSATSTTRTPPGAREHRTPGRRVLRAAARLTGAVLLLAPLLAGVPLLAVTSTPAVAAGSAGVCTDDSGVTVVVDYQGLGGGTVARCAERYSGSSGVDALIAAGFAVQGTSDYGTDFICRLDGRPAASETIPREDLPGYRESCRSTPPASAYWSYWHAQDGGRWTYSQKGAGNRNPAPGTFEGWSFSLNATEDTNPPPRLAPARPEPATSTSREEQPGSAAAPTSRPSSSSQPQDPAGSTTRRGSKSEDGERSGNSSGSAGSGSSGRDRDDSGGDTGSGRGSDSGSGSGSDSGSDSGSQDQPSSDRAAGSDDSGSDDSGSDDSRPDGARDVAADSADGSASARPSERPGSVSPSPQRPSPSPDPAGPDAVGSPRSVAGEAVGLAGERTGDDQGAPAGGPSAGLLAGIGVLLLGAGAAGVIGWRRSRP